jgi:hypothetical protein
MLSPSGALLPPTKLSDEQLRAIAEIQAAPSQVPPSRLGNWGDLAPGAPQGPARSTGDLLEGPSFASLRQKQLPGFVHEAEKPNPAKPVADVLRDFVHGGLHGVLKNRGVGMPKWMDELAGFLQRDDVNTAMGVVGGPPSSKLSPIIKRPSDVPLLPAPERRLALPPPRPAQAAIGSDTARSPPDLAGSAATAPAAPAEAPPLANAPAAPGPPSPVGPAAVTAAMGRTGRTVGASGSAEKRDRAVGRRPSWQVRHLRSNGPERHT